MKIKLLLVRHIAPRVTLLLGVVVRMVADVQLCQTGMSFEEDVLGM